MVVDTGSFLKFESVGSLGSPFDYRDRYPRTSPSWWSADATPGVTYTIFGVLVVATTDESHRIQIESTGFLSAPAHGDC